MNRDGWIDAHVLAAYRENEDDTRVQQGWRRAELDWVVAHESGRREGGWRRD